MVLACTFTHRVVEQTLVIFLSRLKATKLRSLQPNHPEFFEITREPCFLTGIVFLDLRGHPIHGLDLTRF